VIDATIRRRIRDYWRTGGIPEQASEDPPRPLWIKVVGVSIVMPTGLAVGGTVLLPILAALWPLSGADYLIVVGVGYVVSNRAGIYLGGPLADHALGVRRVATGVRES